MRRLPMAPAALLFLVQALFVAGCQWAAWRHGSAEPLPNPIGVEVGQVAPDIDGDDLFGQRLRLSDYRGQVVVVSFWSRT
jgi:hypothetical protein